MADVTWWKVAGPVGVSVDGAEGPGSYGLNRNVNVTVLVASQQRVVANSANILLEGRGLPVTRQIATRRYLTQWAKQ